MTFDSIGQTVLTRPRHVVAGVWLIVVNGFQPRTGHSVPSRLPLDLRAKGNGLIEGTSGHIKIAQNWNG